MLLFTACIFILLEYRVVRDASTLPGYDMWCLQIVNFKNTIWTWRHADFRGLPWGPPKVVGTVQEVYYSRRILLRRGLDFHVCTINKSAHTKNVWNLLFDSRTRSFLSCLKLIWIHSFSCPSLIALQTMKNLICFIAIAGIEVMGSYCFQVH